MAILILHLSDIHIKSSRDSILTKAKEIAASTYGYLPGISQILIVVSGDIAFSGQRSEYEMAEIFLKEIRDTIANESGLPVIFFVAPGNHDCDFKSNNATRKLLLKQIAESDLTELDDSVIDACTTIQSAFFKFRGGGAWRAGDRDRADGRDARSRSRGGAAGCAAGSGVRPGARQMRARLYTRADFRPARGTWQGVLSCGTLHPEDVTARSRFTYCRHASSP